MGESLGVVVDERSVNGSGKMIRASSSSSGSNDGFEIQYPVLSSVGPWAFNKARETLGRV